MIASGERDPHAAPHDRVELTPPDIEPYRQGNTSVPYVTTLDSGVAGPHAMINALMHGNEISGAIAVDHLLQRGIRPTRGRLTLAFANTTAFGMFSRERPYESRFIDEDLNRLWDDDVLSDHKRSVERLRARALRPIIDTVDHLLDLHSMQSGTRPILLCGPSPKGRDFARRLGGPAAIVADVGHADGVRLRDYADFNHAASPRNALLAECGAHWAPRTAVTAIEMAYRFLVAVDMIPPALAAPHMTERVAPDHWVEVTDRVVPRNPDASFVETFHGLETIDTAGTLIARDGARDIRTPYDDCVLIMPARQLTPGQTAVRLGRKRRFEDHHAS